MAGKTINHFKLGLFTIAGLALLVFLLYVIGKNQNMFGRTFILKARFDNVQGLMPGNNVRFAGINAGTVKDVEVINDSTVEVTLLIKSKMKNFIRKNAIISIGTDGIMGNKLINIETVKAPAPLVQSGDILQTEKEVSTDDMLKVLSNTNNDVAQIAMELKEVAKRINSSEAFWRILNDESLPQNLRLSAISARSGLQHMERFMQDLQLIIADVKKGRGSVGELLTDTAIAYQLKETIINIKKTAAGVDSLSHQVGLVVHTLNNEINTGKGSVAALLNDQEMKNNIIKSLKNIEKGTRSFEENMEALKSNFLFRGYFKKMQKQKNGKQELGK